MASKKGSGPKLKTSGAGNEWQSSGRTKQVESREPSNESRKERTHRLTARKAPVVAQVDTFVPSSY